MVCPSPVADHGVGGWAMRPGRRHWVLPCGLCRGGRAVLDAVTQQAIVLKQAGQGSQCGMQRVMWYGASYVPRDMCGSRHSCGMAPPMARMVQARRGGDPRSERAGVARCRFGQPLVESLLARLPHVVRRPEVAIGRRPARPCERASSFGVTCGPRSSAFSLLSSLAGAQENRAALREHTQAQGRAAVPPPRHCGRLDPRGRVVEGPRRRGLPGAGRERHGPRPQCPWAAASAPVRAPAWKCAGGEGVAPDSGVADFRAHARARGAHGGRLCGMRSV